MASKPQQPHPQPPATEECPPVTADDAFRRALCGLRDLAPDLERAIKSGMTYDQAMGAAVVQAREAFGEWMFFAALSPDLRPIPVEDYSDCWDVLVNRGGTIKGIIAEVKSGKFRNWPRDAKGFLIFAKDNEAA